MYHVEKQKKNNVMEKRETGWSTRSPCR